MKIAFVYDCLYPYSKGGGEKRFYEVARRLADQHDVHLFGMRYWSGAEAQKKDGLTYHGVCKAMRLYGKGGKRRILPPIYFSLRVFIPLLRQKFDIVDCSAFPFFSVFPVWLYGKIRRVPIVFTWHEYWGSYWFRYLGVAGILGYIVEVMALFLSQNIIAVSKQTQQDVRKHLKRRSNVWLVPNGIQLPSISKDEQDRPVDVVYAGRLIEHKHVDVLLRAIALLVRQRAQLRCVIVGEGHELAALQRLTQELSIEHNITFAGFAKDEQALYVILQSAKIFALPSTREGFGMTLVEANACGLPAITVNHQQNAAQHLVENGRNGYVVDLSSAALADAVNKLLADKKLLAGMRQYAHASAQRYDWSVILPSLERVYRSLLK